jgi:magnesium-transporting ATPase (P-type)
LILQGEVSSSFTQKDKTRLQAKRKIKLLRVFEREFSDFIIIQLSEFYIISKLIYRREILVEKVNLSLVVIVNLIVVVIVNPILKGKQIKLFIMIFLLF